MSKGTKSTRENSNTKQLSRFILDLRQRPSFKYAISACVLLLLTYIYYTMNHNVIVKTPWKSTIPTPTPTSTSTTTTGQLKNTRKMKSFDSSESGKGSQSLLNGWITSSPRSITEYLSIEPSHSSLTLINTYPHDKNAFTQGLAFDDEGRLFETTGLTGRSELREVDLSTGNVLRRVRLPSTHFGEGMVVVGSLIYVLTWQNHIVHVFNKDTFAKVKTFRIDRDGWGLTHDPDTDELIISDGSHRLTWYNRHTMKATRQIYVAQYNPRYNPSIRGSRQFINVDQLNELEVINGDIWANIWHKDVIAVIDIKSGIIKRYIDGSHLHPSSDRVNSEAVFNGIAYNKNTDTIFVTGKLWPIMLEVHDNQ